MSVVEDFRGAKLNDTRLERRLVAIVGQLAVDPTRSFPKAARTEAAAEAIYRFLRNPKTGLLAVIEPHLASTAARVAAASMTTPGMEVLVAHDTSTLSFRTEREGLGPTNDGGNGMFVHVSLALSGDVAQTPLGIAAVAAYTRKGPSKKQRHTEDTPPASRESYRWLTGIREAKDRLGARKSIHLGDSEIDTYLTMEGTIAEGERFVFRANHDRLVVTEERGREKLSRALEGLTGVVDRDVYLSDRAPKTVGATTKQQRNMPRVGRPARLSFSAREVTIRATESHAKTRSLTLNVVHVREVDAPPDVQAVEWVLYTSEPIDTPEAVARVVDYYRARWRIEELFKALKTGCAFEDRQLESFKTITVALALFLPIACDLLALRALARAEPTRPASAVLSATLLLLLQHLPDTKLKVGATIEEAMLAIARLGGHLRQNGPPGWQVLGRGYATALQLVEGMQLGARLVAEIQ